MGTIYVPYSFIDENGNVIEEIREAKEISIFKRIKNLIVAIFYNITDMGTIYVPYTFVDEYGNVITEMRETKEISIFKKIKNLIFAIFYNIVDN